MNRIPRDEAENILRRAIEYDADEKNILSVEELHAIARELNISSRAVDLALRSNIDVSLTLQQNVTPVSYAPSLLQPKHMAVVGAVLLVMAEAIHSNDNIILATAYASIAVFALAQNNPIERFSRTVRASACLWLSAALTSMLFEPPGPRMFMKALMYFGISCAFGFAAAGLRSLMDKQPPGVGSNPTNKTPPSQGGDSFRIRMLKRIARWLPGDPMSSSIADRVAGLFRTA